MDAGVDWRDCQLPLHLRQLPPMATSRTPSPLLLPPATGDLSLPNHGSTSIRPETLLEEELRIVVLPSQCGHLTDSLLPTLQLHPHRTDSHASA